MNKLTKVLVSGAALFATVGAGVYVKNIYDAQHTIDVPMQVSGAYGQNLNDVAGLELHHEVSMMKWIKALKSGLVNTSINLYQSK